MVDTTLSSAQEETITSSEPEEEKRLSLEETIIGETEEIESKTTIFPFHSRLRIRDGYFYNYTNLNIYNNLNFGWTILQRNEEIPPFDWHNFWQDKLKKYYLKYENITKDNKIIVGNYALSYGQGLVFHTPLSELVRAIKVQPSGLREEKGTNENTYLRGFAWEKKIKNFTGTVFYSSVDLDGEKSPDGSFDEDLNQLRENYGSLETTNDLAENNKLEEKLFGARFSYQPGENTAIGITGYQSEYNPTINPDKTDNRGYQLSSADGEKWKYVFRGERNKVFGFDFIQKYKILDFFGEYGYSESQVKGNAWIIGLITKFNKANFFTSIYDYSPEYFNRHSKGEILYSDSVTQNQKGAIWGMKYQPKRQKIFFSYRLAKILQTLWSGYPTSRLPRYPADAWEIWFEYTYKLGKYLELYFRQWNDRRERYFAKPDTQINQYRERSRYQVSWQKKKNLRFRIRYETKNEEYPDLNQKDYGELYFFDLLTHPGLDLNLNVRLIFFDAKEVYLSETEPSWNDVYLSELLPKKKGERFYFLLEKKFAKNVSFWLKFEETFTDSRKQEVKVQFDFYH